MSADSTSTPGPVTSEIPLEQRNVSIDLRMLRREFGDMVAVNSINVKIREAEFFSLIGPSGCGKTTTLRMIAGLEVPTSGTIEVQGSDLTYVPAHQRPVNTVFQNYALFPHLNVFENVAFGLKERKVDKQAIRTQVGEMLELVDLGDRAKSKPSELSGGMQQRVALARALILNPKVLLLDEPLGALDLKLRRRMQLSLKQVQEEVEVTFVYVTHDQEEAFFMSDRVAIMNDGIVEQVGSPREVYVEPKTRFVADFVGTSNQFAGKVTEVRTDGVYEVELEGIGTTESEGVPGLVAGEAVSAIVRPEVIGLAGQGQDDSLGFDGRVVDIAYLGSLTSYQVAREGGEGLTTINQGSGRGVGPQIKVGQTVRFSWGRESTWLVPAKSMSWSPPVK